MRGMRRWAALIVMATVAMVARAAEEAWDVVETARGERILCRVVEMVSGGSVRLRLTDGSELTLPMSEVGKITPRAERQAEEEMPPKPVKERRFVRHTGLSFAVGPDLNDDGDYTYVGVGLQAGYRPIPGLMIGAGVMPSSIGCDDNFEPFRYNKRFFAMPVYGVVKYEFVRKMASPFLATRLGAMMIDGSWMLKGDKVESGLYFHASAGVRIAIWKIAISPYLGGSYVGIDDISDREYYKYHKSFTTMGVMVEF